MIIVQRPCQLAPPVAQFLLHQNAAKAGAFKNGPEWSECGRDRREAAAFASIPVIDIAALSGTDRAASEAAAREIGAACQTVGFFYIRNHGVPQPACR